MIQIYTLCYLYIIMMNDVPQVGRTTIIIAHRLATVCKANKIAAVYRGRVLEQVGQCSK